MCLCESMEFQLLFKGFMCRSSAHVNCSHSHLLFIYIQRSCKLSPQGLYVWKQMSECPPPAGSGLDNVRPLEKMAGLTLVLKQPRPIFIPAHIVKYIIYNSYMWIDDSIAFTLVLDVVMLHLWAPLAGGSHSQSIFKPLTSYARCKWPI